MQSFSLVFLKNTAPPRLCAIRGGWIAALWGLLLVFGSLMPRVAWAQYTTPLPQLWQQAYEFPGLCTGTIPSTDWSLGITTTRDGGYISAGYGGGIGASGCTPIQPILTKFRADRSVEWQYTYAAPPSTFGRYCEVIELADGSGFVAAGYVGTKMLVTKLAVTNGVMNVVWERYNTLGFNARAYSVREVLTDGPTGLVGSGFIVGGTYDPSGSNFNPYELYMLRVDDAGGRLWQADLGESATSTGYGAIVRPIYSTGTNHIPTADRPAHVPMAGGTVTGFALTGLRNRRVDQNGLTITSPPTESELESAVVISYSDLALGIISGDPLPTSTMLSATCLTYESTGFASNNGQNTGFPYCPSFDRTTGTAPGIDLGTDLEQNEAGDRLVVAGIYNRMVQLNCAPPANPNGDPTITRIFTAGETYLLEWPLTASTAQVTTPHIVFTGIGGAGEYRPQVEPLPGGGYLLAASKLASSADSATVGQWGENRYYVAHYSTGTATTPPTRTWGKTFSSPTVAPPLRNILACTLGMALTQDGGCLVSGNDNKYDGTIKNHDVIITKLGQLCPPVTSSFDVVAANNALPVNNWTTARRVRGTVTVKSGGVLTISGPGTLIEFADTRAYQLPTTPKGNPLNPTRIMVEPGGKLIIRDDAHLTVLNDPACDAPGAMWDGIVLKGIPTAAQTVSQTGVSLQPVIELSGCTIEKAHVGVLAGRMNYNSTNGLPAPVLNDGGGLVTATNVLFRNCYNGVNLQTYGRSATAPSASLLNGSRFTGCTFRADAVLEDPLYITASTATPANVRLPSQAGLKIFTTQGVVVEGCTFELVGDGPASFPMIPVNQRGLGIYASNANIIVQPTATNAKNTFRRLYTGVLSSNISLAYAVVVHQAEFVNCVGGVSLSGVAVPKITENTFVVGRSTDAFPYGLSMYNSYGYDVSNNTFSGSASALPGSEAGSSTARGLNVTLSDGNNPGVMRSNLIYRNTFTTLFNGIYGQRGNSSLLLKCNTFTTGTLSRADVEVQVGSQPSNVDPLLNPHGICNIDKAIRNTFSGTTTGKSFWITGSANQFVYNPFLGYQPPSGTYTSNVTVPFCSAPPDDQRNCPTQRPTALLTANELNASLDTLTDAAARAEVLDELLRRYLNPTLYVTGLDSAVALLQRVTDPAYSEQRTALESLNGYTPASRSLAVAGPKNVAPLTRRQQRQVAKHQSPAVSTASRTSTGGTYFDEVRELLAPFGSDSAIVAALETDAALLARFEQIANDTTTWGYVAGQTVLSNYLGYQFRPWFENTPDLSAEASRIAQDAATAKQQPAGRPAATLALYPNPATDAVQLDYRQPTRSEGTWQLQDRFGHVCRRVTLTGATTTATVTLNGLLPGLYYYSYDVDGARVQAGILQKQ